MAGRSRGRALLLALIAVVALAVALGRPPAHPEVGGGEAGDGVHAAHVRIEPQRAVVRSLDETTARRWSDGRPARLPVAWVFAVLVAVTVATAGCRRETARRGRSLPVAWPGLRALAPRAPPVLVQPL